MDSPLKKSKVDFDCVRIGDWSVSGVALGTLQLSVNYPTPRCSREEALAIIGAARDAGVTFFDTSDCYGRNNTDLHYAEDLLKTSALPSSSCLVCAKGGMTRTQEEHIAGKAWGFPISDPKRIVQCIEQTMAHLQNPLPLWMVHHVEPQHTVNVMRAADEMRKKGLIQMLGCSNVSVGQLETLQKEGIPIVCVQNEFSIYTRTAATPFNGNKTGKTGVIDYCRDHGIVFMAYSPFGGLKTRRGERKPLEEQFPDLARVAQEKKCDPHALLLKVMRTLWPHVVPIVGTRRKDRAARLMDYQKIDLTIQEAKQLWPKK